MKNNRVIKNSGIIENDENIEAVNIEMDEIDDHFTQKLNDNLYKIREQQHHSYENSIKLPIQNPHRGSDSPLTMSINSEDEDNTLCTNEINMNEVYVIDVLNTYFKCQKHIYERANTITQWKYNGIFGVTITITSSICIFISFLETYQWRTIIIIVLNAIVTLLLVITKHLKLEQNAAIYLYLSRQCEFISDSMKHIHPHKSFNGTKIRELENRFVETRDIPNIIIPQSIQVLYPVSSNVNIFAFIKKVNMRTQYVTDELNTVKYEIEYILKKYKDNMGQRESNRLHYLIDVKENLKKELKLAQTAYVYMEEIFTREINKADYYRQTYTQLWFNSNTDFAINHSHCNSFVDEHIAFILPKK